MRADQQIEVLQTGFRNTVFKNLGFIEIQLKRFFGDAKHIITCHDKDAKTITYLIVNGKDAREPYRRIITVIYEEREQNSFPYKILDIVE